ncbi:cuticle protein 5-like [Leptopilina heterotoma]|uniref:cuticle protein 5-like n=1 Tax=Leptopilina heterotoma TaxID=63436 RepID=UPI001CA93C04|nr:cuticle protein 5-like [Leptopilina heterotoma]
MKSLVVIASMVSVIFATPEYYAGGQYPYQGPSAPIGHDGRVIDTPEVAFAKAAHLQAYADIAARIPFAGPSDDYEGNNSHDNNDYNQVHMYNSHPYASGSYGYSSPAQFSSRIFHVPQGYHGPSAPLNHEGRVIDTPEVAQAKAAHFAALQHAGSAGAYNSHHPHESPAKFAYGVIPPPPHHQHNYAAPIYGVGNYHGPSAPLAHDGRVIDTPEVNQAKAAHFAAIAKATHGPYGHYGIY